MANILPLKVGDYIDNKNFGSERYEIIEWSEDINDDNMALRSVMEGESNRRITYQKHYLTDDKWKILSTAAEREIGLAGRILKSLSGESKDQINELLVRLEI